MGNNSGGGSHKTMKIFGLVLTFLLAVSNGKLIDEEWESFKKVWGKEYKSGEDSLRHGLWQSNKALVENHNMKAEKSFTLALNEASDWTEEEVANFRLGYIDLDEGEGKTFPEREGRPDLLDHREAGLVTEVKNQGHCGSCWAFSATGGIEGVWAKQVGELIPVSEQQLMDCGPGGCQGGNMGKAWNTAADGIMREEDYQYEHEEKECRYDENKAVSYVTGHRSVPHDEEQLELALAEIGCPISIGMRASATFQHYSNGVYDDLECVNDGKANHAILIVGYHKTNPDNMYWIVKNSWGHKWGKDGYIKMKMGHNICDMANHASYPTLDI